MGVSEARAPQVAAAKPRDRAVSKKGPRTAGRLTPFLFLAPYLVLFVTFVLYPAISSIWVSLHDWDYFLPNKPFVGVENFTDLFTAGTTTSGFFWQSMSATAQFTLYSVPPLVILPLAVAVMLNQKFRGRNVFRAIYFAPYVLGVAVIGLLWRYLLDPNVGVVNYYLGKIGLSDPNNPIGWTTDLPWAWVTLVGMTVWWTLGFNTVIYLAGLQGIDRELYDAAEVDGASKWEQFRYVTLPGLRAVMVFVIMITILASANMFGQSYLTTQGAPGRSTQTAVMYIFEEGIRNFRMGSAAAMSVMLAIFLAIIGILNFKFLGQTED